MRVIIRKWSSSAGVRIPASVMAAAHLSLDQQVEVREEEGRIIIEPTKAGHYGLASLVDAITDDNRHAAAEFGATRGGEAW